MRMSDSVAERDQRQAFYTDQAQRSWDFYEAHIRVGFNPDQAMELLANWTHLSHSMLMHYTMDDEGHDAE